MKSTPGPWVYNNFHEVYSIKTNEIICEVSLINDDTEDTVKSHTNGHLIASAPELLEALEELMAVQNGPPLITYTKDWEKAMDLAEKAIAKAEGK